MRKKREAITLTSLKELAKSRGGECLAESYQNAHQRIPWRCGAGHVWFTTANSVRRGSWCKCEAIMRRARSSRKYDISYFHDYARRHDGICLSTIYEPRVPLRFRCSSGHEFNLPAGKVTHRRSWCPTCRMSKMELLCRMIYELGFQESFPRVNPGFMKHGKGNLQLDGYCASLRLAFEYQGEQHFSAKTLFGGAMELERRVAIDAMKVSLCCHAGVTLVQIPTIPKDTTLKMIIEHVVATVPEAFSARFDASKITPAYLDMQEFETTKKKVLTMIEAKGGSLLSIAVPTVTTRIEVVCANGHVFTTSGHRLAQGKWCQRCAPNCKIPVQDIKELIESKGGRFIERVALGGQTRVRLMCSEGHIWETRQSHLRNGHWCYQCALSRDSARLVVAQDLAHAKGGECLSARCPGIMATLEWQCAEGHQFHATLNEVKNMNYWCPVCTKSTRRMYRMISKGKIF